MSQCKHIEDFIIKRMVAPVNAKDEQMISEHILTCASCKAYEHNMLSLAMLDPVEIKPRPSIKKELLRKMHLRTQSQKIGLVDRIAEIVSFRASFYKVAVVAMLLFLIVLSVPQFKQPQQISTQEYKTTMIDSVSLNVVNLNQIIQIVDSQRVGLNLRQDTVLAKILYTL